MTDQSPDMIPDILPKSLARIHLVITRGVETARERSHAYAGGEPASPEAIAGFVDYLHTLASILHGHHTGEEELVFPAIRDRFQDAPWALLEQEHRAMVPVIEELKACAAQLRDAPSQEVWTNTASVLDRLALLWEPHYQREETHMSAADVAALIPLSEQQSLVAAAAAHSQQHTGPDYLVLPFLLYNLDGDERLAMAALFPPVVTQQLVPIAWKDKWSPMKPFLLA